MFGCELKFVKKPALSAHRGCGYHSMPALTFTNSTSLTNRYGGTGNVWYEHRENIFASIQVLLSDLSVTKTAVTVWFNYP